MILPSYDVIVVGAGPAGSVTARNLARAGYAVLLCEKRPVVGVPVRCGEATGPAKRISDFTTLDEAWIETRFSGVVFHGPGGVSFKYDAGRELGIMLDRRLFDQHLAREAEAAGAHLRTGARVTDVGPDADGHRVVTLEHDGVFHHVKTKMVVGADGAESLVGRMAGLKTRQLPNGTCTAIELRIRTQDPNPDCLTFWGGAEHIDKGYVWAFPKVKSGVVNLGSGELIPKLGAKTQLQISTEFRDKYYPGAVIEEVHGGAVPVSGHMQEYTAGRLALVGDAAHHTNPLTGGGIVPGMLGGEYLATWIDKGFKAGDLSHGFLKGYEQAMWERNGKNHLREMRMRDFVLGLDRPNQVSFYRALKGMVDGNLSLPSKIVGYSKLGALGLKNFGLLRKTVLAKV